MLDSLCCPAIEELRICLLTRRVEAVAAAALLGVSRTGIFALAIILAFGCAAAAITLAGVLALAGVLFNFGLGGLCSGVSFGSAIRFRSILSEGILSSGESCQSRTHKQ
jgi:hypothetical protein